MVQGKRLQQTILNRSDKISGERSCQQLQHKGTEKGASKFIHRDLCTQHLVLPFCQFLHSLDKEQPRATLGNLSFELKVFIIYYI